MIQNTYIHFTGQLDQLHWFFLERLKEELDRIGVRHLTPQQALILYNLGDQKISIRDIVKKGYYSGSNVSYNVKKLLNIEYIACEKISRDRRLTTIFLTVKGQDLWRGIHAFFDHQVEIIKNENFSDQELEVLYRQIQRLNFLFFKNHEKKAFF